MFREIATDDFPPFGKARFSFPAAPDNTPPNLAEVHLLTGVNGTGKTRLLCLLAAALGNPEPLKKRIKGIRPAEVTFEPGSNPQSRARLIDSGLNWMVGGKIEQWVPKVPAFAYGGMAYLGDAPITIMADVPVPDRAACLAFNRPENQSAALLQAIANLKVQSAMDSQDVPEQTNGAAVAHPPSHATGLVRALENAVRTITNQRFSFQFTSYPKAALGVAWGGMKLPFDALPDGLRSIIGWRAHSVVRSAWKLIPASRHGRTPRPPAAA